MTIRDPASGLLVLEHDFDPGFAPLVLAQARDNLRLFALMSERAPRERLHLERLAFAALCRANDVDPASPNAWQQLKAKIVAKALLCSAPKRFT